MLKEHNQTILPRGHLRTSLVRMPDAGDCTPENLEVSRTFRGNGSTPLVSALGLNCRT